MSFTRSTLWLVLEAQAQYCLHIAARKLFNIVNDFTPEEEAQIKKENEWAEDR